MALKKKAKLPKEHRWPEGAIVYHIYPRSLQDSNNDGIGDLMGVISRLDYLKSLSVNAIWLSPFYPSPMADFGYDVADYCDVDPMFGTLDDFKELLAEAGKRDIKVMIDLVPNHTSDEHEWFKQSKSSAQTPYDDWYIWRDGHIDPETGHRSPPNNWLDIFTGKSAWEWVPERQQFYLHSFDVRQPDLNWANPEVREAIKDVMRFWLDLGVDGFRVDAVYFMGKDPLLTDNPPNPHYQDGEGAQSYHSLLHVNSQQWPMVYPYLNEMADVLKEEKYQHKHRFMVTEAYAEHHNHVASYMAFYVGMDPKVAAPFNFEGISLPWEAQPWKEFLHAFHTTIDHFSPYCVPSYAFGNHDQPRLIDRLGHAEAARGAAVMLLTLPGMAFIYYGEEIGMHNVEIPQEYVHDPAALGNPGGFTGRDPERTPMQWTPGKYGGFTEGEPWLPLAADYREVNVEVEEKDPGSFLSLYRALGKLRHDELAFKIGSFKVIDTGSPEVLGYVREDETGKAFLVLINFAAFIATCHLKHEPKKLIISSKPDSIINVHNKLVLQPYEAAVFSL